MRGENLREGKEAKELSYSFRLGNKLVKIERNWRTHPKLYIPIQKHTNRVILLSTFPAPPVIADAVITNLRGVTIGVKTADCVPVVLLGEEYVAVIHVGWKGLASGIIEKTVSRFAQLQDLKKTFAFLGPSAKACCYEVGEEFKNLFPGKLIEREGKLYMDLQNVVNEELKQLGIPSTGLYERCTICSNDLPSYRRDRTEERLLTSVTIL